MNPTLVLPELLLTAAIFVVFVTDLFVPERHKRALGHLSVLLLLLLLAFTAFQGALGVLYGGVYLVDTFTHFFRLLFPLITIFIIWLSLDYVATRLRYGGEYYSLLLMATLAMVLMAGAGELITAYISLELLNFCLYVLASYAKHDAKSNEAGLKYIILSVLASAVLLYGISYLYGITGSTTYTEIARALAQQDASPGLIASLVLITAGLGFKVSAVPFHMWAPDVYEGAPTPITAFIAVASKAAGFALVLRLFSTALLPAIDTWAPVVAGLAAVTMTVGNLIALRQQNIKRLLAYSSIGQVGYLLMGVAALSSFSASGILFYLAGYAATNLAAFLCIVAYQNLTDREDIDGYAGLAQRAPFLALGLTTALFSLAGLPLLAGFTTKFYLFTAAASQGYLWLVALAVINSLVSLYYYLRVVRQIYIAAPENTARLAVPALGNGVLAVLVALVVLVGVYPGPLVSIIDVAARALGLPG